MTAPTPNGDTKEHPLSDLLQTPLSAWHRAAGAKMAPFAGWDMPIQYPTGIIAEHVQTRESAALFDICHMGEFTLRGPGARDALSRAVSHNLETLKPGRCRYGFLLNEAGGILDDLIVYCIAEDDYMLVVNGACTESDFAALRSRLPESLPFEDISARTGKLDLQGPKSFDVLEAVLGESFRDLPYFGFRSVTFGGAPLLVSRTGYTGELGVELYLPWDKAEALWTALLADERVKPAGLGARDTLRLEVGLPLYGHDLDDTHTPAEAGYGGMLTNPADYVGKGADREVREPLVALSIPGRRSARHGDVVALPDGTVAGVVTSGSFCPSLGYAVALARVTAAHAETPTFVIKAAKVELEATRVALPFYTQGTARTKLA
ncbi:glycine cleavage system aminomethyltransferase GcvT [Desulfovibrio oxamicus]|uniref:aminomethyltransferase n=1 Tax=Nitratidesulfovibrio oxamicus TaxID=32016 RepID=A0ABS0IZE1_9BACT|nr:glycine cleavage system aminomethyltransferase GcvT [Nitratidesulfovibrio oxamicus]